jgi:hypothetical protein
MTADSRRQAVRDRLRNDGHCTCSPRLTPIPEEQWPAGATCAWIVEHQPGCMRAVVFTQMKNVRSTWLSGPRGLIVEVDL